MTRAFVIVFLVLLTSSSSRCTTPSRWGRFHRLSYMDDRFVVVPSGALEDTRVGYVKNATSHSQCAQTCLTEESCVSFFHDQDASECVLHSIVFLASDEATNNSGVTYWRLSTDDCNIDDGFFLYRPLKLCYKYHFQTVFWDVAQTTCAGSNTSLIKLDTQAKFQHLYLFLRGSTSTRLQHVSIGVSDKSGSLKWLDGSAANWSNWAAGEPSSVTENCTTMAWFYYFKWNDVPCSVDPTAKYNFICQKII